MEKIGVEVEILPHKMEITKEASEKNKRKDDVCDHPSNMLVRPDPETTFCKKCGKYLR